MNQNTVLQSVLVDGDQLEKVRSEVGMAGLETEKIKMVKKQKVSQSGKLQMTSPTLRGKAVTHYKPEMKVMS
jgi:hypothetical protein